MFHFFLNENNKLDINLEKEENELESSVLFSLFSNQYISAEELNSENSLGGWWGDLITPETKIKRLGSKIYIMLRDKLLPDTKDKLKTYIEEALQWLIDDGVAVNLLVDVQKLTETSLASSVEIVRPQGKKNQKYEFVWKF